MSPTAIRSKRPNAAPNRSRPAADLLQRRPERLRERGRSERVVDVVEAGEGQPKADAPLRRLERERRRLEPVELDLRRPHLQRGPRVAAGRAAVVAEVADVGGREVVGLAAAHAVAGVGGVLERGARVPRVVDPVRDRTVAVVGASSPTCGSSPLTTSTVSGGARRLPRASARRCARARRSGRAGRGRGCRGGSRAAERGGRPPAARPRRPRAARARRRARRAASRRRRRRGSRPSCSRRAGSAEPRISATIAVVVVLPFVAETTAAPCGSRAASASIAPGSSFQSSFPGSVVPPPAPATRDRRAAARAANDSTARRALTAAEPSRAAARRPSIE